MKKNKYKSVLKLDTSLGVGPFLLHLILFISETISQICLKISHKKFYKKCNVKTELHCIKIFIKIKIKHFGC